jgi:hypothetical protein
MVMRTTLDNGLGLVRGDVFSLRRTVTGLPTGVTVAKAWLMVKTAYSVADGSATISKAITSSNVAGTGQIEVSGSGTGRVAVLRFDLTNTNTTAVTAGVVYVYDIQVLLSNADIVTIESGTATWASEVAQATS